MVYITLRKYLKKLPELRNNYLIENNDLVRKNVYYEEIPDKNNLKCIILKKHFKRQPTKIKIIYSYLQMTFGEKEYTVLSRYTFK